MGGCARRPLIRRAAIVSSIVISGVVATVYQGCNLGTDSFRSANHASSSASADDIKDLEVSKVCGESYDPGRTNVRRLTNQEYNNTVRDLFYVDLEPASSFPASNPGASGFLNDANALLISEELVHKYYEAAEQIAQTVLATKGQSQGAYSKIANCAGSASSGADFTVEASAMNVRVGDPENVADGVRLWQPSSIGTRLTLPTTGVHQITVSARGELAGNEPPTLEIRVDGQAVTTIPVPATGLADYSYELNLSAGSRLIELAFVNDYFEGANDRNLVISSLKLKANQSAGGGKVGPVTLQQCRDQVVRNLASRAYRRPLRAEDNEFDRLVEIFNAGRNFDEGLNDLIVALMIDPKFLFLSSEKPGANPSASSWFITEFELASRLSYFIWQSMPDDRLFETAEKGLLSQTETLKGEIRRMLADPRASALIGTLRREWVGLARFEDSEVPGLSEELRQAMVNETDHLFSYIVKNDRSYLETVNARYTFVNEALANYYGVPFAGSDPEEFVQVTLPKDQRIGVGTHASILITTAGALTETHPVRRGFWAADRLLCSPPPPPPPGLPTLDDSASKDLPIRERLAIHSQGACYGCHKVMDTVGLGLENFDPLGQWRFKYPDENASIDASGKLPDGQTFSTPTQMFELMSKDPAVRACLANKLMGLAASREMRSSSDKCVSNVIGQVAVSEKGTFSDLIERIVFSFQFRMQSVEEN